MAGHWIVQHTEPVRPKPDGKPGVEGANYKYPTSYISLLHPTCHAYTSTHLLILLLSPG